MLDSTANIIENTIPNNQLSYDYDIKFLLSPSLNSPAEIFTLSSSETLASVPVPSKENDTKWRGRKGKGELGEVGLKQVRGLACHKQTSLIIICCCVFVSLYCLW